MELSRSARRFANSRRERQLLFVLFISGAWLLVLTISWRIFGLAVFSLLGLATIIQLLISNRAKVRLLLPGLVQSNRWIKAISTIGYVLLVFWVVSEMSKGN